MFRIEERVHEVNYFSYVQTQNLPLGFKYSPV